MAKEEVVTKLGNGRIEIRPELHEVQRRPQSQAEAGTKVNLVGRNASLFCGYVYQAIFGGRAVRASTDRPNGNNDHFRPDHIQRADHYLIHTEIKSFAGRNTRAHCGGAQFFRYSHAFLDTLRGGQEVPIFQYAFFRYGQRDPNLGLVRLSNHGLVRVLSKNIRDLLVVPPNLSILSFIASPGCVRDQTNHRPGSDNVLYWKPSGADRTSLLRYEPEQAIEKLKRRATKRLGFSPFLEEDELMLDDLVVERIMSPKMYAVHGKRKYLITPFPIVVYRNKTPEAWAEHFRENFDYFSERLGGDQTASTREYDPDEINGDVSFNTAGFR